MAPGSPALDIIYTAKARRDLREIFDFNADRYGFEHASGYVDVLISGIETLAHNQAQGRPVESSPN